MDDDKLEYLNSLQNDIDDLKKSNLEKVAFTKIDTPTIFNDDTN